ncbi:MAG: hypothetical protein V1682_06185 [Candidatus Omnitrophota bacterium]
MPDRGLLIIMMSVFSFSSLMIPAFAADEEKGAYETQVPPGMELIKVGNKDSYRVVVPKGTSFRREGDLRIIEGSGEYASRKFLDYDARLDKMNAAIESLAKDVEGLKATLADMRKAALTSKER